MASPPSTLTSWAKRALAKPVMYEQIPEDDTLVVRTACVFQERVPLVSGRTNHVVANLQEQYVGIVLGNVQRATMNLKIRNFMTMSLLRKSVKPFGELQISCRGRFGIAHLVVLLK